MKSTIVFLLLLFLLLATVVLTAPISGPGDEIAGEMAMTLYEKNLANFRCSGGKRGRGWLRPELLN